MTLTNFLIGLPLMLLCLVVQVAAAFWCVRHCVRHAAPIGHGLLRGVAPLIVATVALLVGTLLQFALWGGLFLWLGEFAQPCDAIYHSAVNFTSLGYGDIVMSRERRLLGPLEAANGMLMLGMSAAALMAIVQHMIAPLREAAAPVKARGTRGRAGARHRLRGGAGRGAIGMQPAGGSRALGLAPSRIDRSPGLVAQTAPGRRQHDPLLAPLVLPDEGGVGLHAFEQRFGRCAARGRHRGLEPLRRAAQGGEQLGFAPVLPRQLVELGVPRTAAAAQRRKQHPLLELVVTGRRMQLGEGGAHRRGLHGDRPPARAGQLLQRTVHGVGLAAVLGVQRGADAHRQRRRGAGCHQRRLAAARAALGQRR